MLTPWQEQVYRAVAEIPAGKVSTYARIAKRCGKPGAARAVGNALRKNPFSFLSEVTLNGFHIPCHRVVKSDGKLGGFDGVMNHEKKQTLLASEGVEVFGGKIQNFSEKTWMPDRG